MSHASARKKAPLVAIALMVKNEEVSIQATLYSMFKAGIHDFFILDTGSTDKTVEIALAFFKQHQLNGYLKQEAFVDFATSRNRTLELTKQHFAHIPFVLMPDAEWFLRNGIELLSFCEQQQHQDTPLYSLTIKMNELEFTVARLFRTNSTIQFKGVVHEVPEIGTHFKVPDPVYFDVQATYKGVEKTKKRWLQDLIMLTKVYETEPTDARNTFYLAQTYHCLNDVENAFRFYQYRSQLQGWDEENFITLLRLGELATKANQDNKLLAWATAMDYYLKAHALRPHRIEPLVQIADYYWPDNIQTCYLFASAAYKKPYPTNDLLFINQDAYRYTRYEIMSRCAWYVGEFALGEEATLLALKAKPGTPHLLNNLKLYQDKLKNIEIKESMELT